ncbi:MAG: hypothetical protein M9934_02550 [Thermomicrobiales bacterium]|nr:hypothetical protein [Thermomicrobiales bacterium]
MAWYWQLSRPVRDSEFFRPQFGWDVINLSKAQQPDRKSILAITFDKDGQTRQFSWENFTKIAGTKISVPESDPLLSELSRRAEDLRKIEEIRLQAESSLHHWFELQQAQIASCFSGVDKVDHDRLGPEEFRQGSIIL